MDDQWRYKYEESEKKLTKLKELANSGVTDYELLLSKYNENIDVHQNVCQKLEETEIKLQELQNVAEPAIEAFMQLRAKHEIEEECRRKAENFASQVYKQNKDLKRQSAVLLQHIDNSQLSIVEIGELIDKNTSEEPAPDNRHLNILIEDLKEQLAKKDSEYRTIENERRKLIQEFQIIKVENESLKKNEESLKKTLDNLSNLSEKAAKQYAELEERYLRETEINEEVAKRSVHLKAERDAIVRQSAHILLEASRDEQLSKALNQIDILTLQLEEIHQQKTSEIDKLKNELDNCKEKQEIDDLKAVIETYEDEISSLRKDTKQLEIDNQGLKDINSKFDKEIVYLRKLVSAGQNHAEALRKESASSSSDIQFIDIDKPDTDKSVENHSSISKLQKHTDYIRLYLKEIEKYFLSSNQNPDQTIVTVFYNIDEEIIKIENGLSKQIQVDKENEKQMNKLKNEIEQLEKDLDVANQKLKSNIPVAPPPPPPPPIALFKPLVDIIKGNKSKKPAVKATEPENKLKMDDTINEMMERIRSGKTLKKVDRRPSLPEKKQDDAIFELKGILMKRSKSLPTKQLPSTNILINNDEILKSKRSNLIKLDAIDEQNNNDDDNSYNERNSTDL